MTNSQAPLISSSGKDKLEKQLANLQNQLAEINYARGSIEGGFHENASAEDNKRQRNLVRAQLKDVRQALRTAKIAPAPQAGVVGIGSTVEVEYASGANATWTVGGYMESDPDNGIVSYDTPLGQALMGARASDTRELKVGKIQSITITAIRH